MVSVDVKHHVYFLTYEKDKKFEKGNFLTPVRTFYLHAMLFSSLFFVLFLLVLQTLLRRESLSVRLSQYSEIHVLHGAVIKHVPMATALTSNRQGMDKVRCEDGCSNVNLLDALRA